jgi:hypothetical protein
MLTPAVSTLQDADYEDGVGALLTPFHGMDLNAKSAFKLVQGAISRHTCALPPRQQLPFLFQVILRTVHADMQLLAHSACEAVTVVLKAAGDDSAEQLAALRAPAATLVASLYATDVDPKLPLHIAKAFSVEEVPGTAEYVHRLASTGNAVLAVSYIVQLLAGGSRDLVVDADTGQLVETPHRDVLLQVLARIAEDGNGKPVLKLLSGHSPEARVAVARHLAAVCADELVREQLTALTLPVSTAKALRSPLWEAPTDLPGLIVTADPAAARSALQMPAVTGSFSNTTATIPLFGVRNGSRLQSSSGARNRKPKAKQGVGVGPSATPCVADKGGIGTHGDERGNGDEDEEDEEGDEDDDEDDDHADVSIPATMAAAAAMPSWKASAERPKIQHHDIERCHRMLRHSLSVLVMHNKVDVAVSMAGVQPDAQRMLLLEVPHRGVPFTLPLCHCRDVLPLS